MSKKRDIPSSLNSFGDEAMPRAPGTPSDIRTGRIPHSKLLREMQLSGKISTTLAEIYQKHVLSGKTRTIQLLGRKHPARIIHTLLGCEVQASYKRIQCPDMVTARYLKLFTELGCRSIKLPYDPTVIAAILPDMEACVANISRGISEFFPKDQVVQNYVLRQIYAILRAQLKKSAQIIASVQEPTPA